MRDDAFGQLGDGAPAFTVDAAGPSSRAANLPRQVEGTYEVPSYLTGTGGPGSVLNIGDGPDSSPIPERNGTYTAQFLCTIPASAVDADGTAAPTRLVLYGHGLLGSAAATARYGLAVLRGDGHDVLRHRRGSACPRRTSRASPPCSATCRAFPTMPDRLQQGILNHLFLGRLMMHPDGLSADPAFQNRRRPPLLDQRELFFDGNSQGGILGGALNAVATDWQRAVLGVPAMNYSTLLDRSIDFDVFAAVLDPAYPDPVDRQLGIALIQMLWDRGETNGYAQHLDRRPVPRDAGPGGPAVRGVRRPPGGQRRPPRSWPAPSAPPCTPRPGRRAQHRRRAVLGHRHDRAVPGPGRLVPGGVGLRHAGAARSRTSPDRAARRGPPRRGPDPFRRRAGAVDDVPGGGRPRRHLRRRPLHRRANPTRGGRWVMCATAGSSQRCRYRSSRCHSSIESTTAALTAACKPKPPQ